MEKKHWNYCFLLIIIIAGLALRMYHVDYPVVGYHNWKEVHYLSEARNFARGGFFEHGFFVPAWDYPSRTHPPSGVHGDTFPTISILAAIAFKIFGVHLIAARIIGVLFSTASIFLFYHVLKQIFQREDISLTGAVLMALNPLMIFFSHNVQLINPGLFFVLLGYYLFFKWTAAGRVKFMLGSSASLTMAILTKYPYAISVIPLFFVVPWKRFVLDFRKDLGCKITALLIPFLVPLWMVYMKSVVEYSTFSQSSITPAKLLTNQFTMSFISFTKDNFTTLGLWFAVFGMIGALYTIKRWQTTHRYIAGSIAAIIIFFPLTAGKIVGHSYHYIYIAPYVIMFIAYFIVLAASSVSTLISSYKHVLKTAVILGLILLIYFPSMEAKDRQFDTQFIGLDAAGDYVKINKNPGERAMHSSHQAYGFLWHGDIKGTRGIPSTVQLMQEAERERNASWIFVYQWDIASVVNSERWDYIQSNYSIKQFAFMQQNGDVTPYYYLFKKGGSFNASMLGTYMQNAKITKKNYEFTYSDVELVVGEW